MDLSGPKANSEPPNSFGMSLASCVDHPASAGTLAWSLQGLPGCYREQFLPYTGGGSCRADQQTLTHESGVLAVCVSQERPGPCVAVSADWGRVCGYIFIYKTANNNNNAPKGGLELWSFGTPSTNHPAPPYHLRCSFYA